MRRWAMLLVVVAGCGSATGAAPQSVEGIWNLEVVNAFGCNDVAIGLLTTSAQFAVNQTGSQVSAQFVEGDGAVCTFSGAYVPDDFTGEFVIDIPLGERTRRLVVRAEGYGRVFGSQRQVDGHLQVISDTEQQCVGGIAEFCAIILGEGGGTSNQPPSVLLIEPAGGTCVVEGDSQPIIYTDDDDGIASTTLLADRDGDRATTDDQIVIAADRPEQNGATQSLDWDTTGVPAANYTIIAVTTDGQFTSTDTARGTVEVICDKPAELAYAKGIGSPIDVDGRGIAAYDDGSFITVGSFEGTATFGAGETNATTLTAVEGEDIYLARYNADGTLRWAKRAGGPDGATDQQEEARGVATFADGSAVIVGRFDGSTTFAPGEANATTLTAQTASDDLFVAKYDADGNLLWVRHGTGDLTNEAYAVSAIPGSNGFFVVGRTNSSMTLNFGETDSQTVVTSDATDFDGFLARYDGDGSLQWVQLVGGTGSRENLENVGAFADGSCVVMGNFPNTTTLGGTNFTSAGADDIFVARYDASGAFVWARVGTSVGDVDGNGVAALVDGSAVITGEFQGRFVLASGAPGQATLVSEGDDDVFVGRFDADGTLLWARRGGGPGNNEGKAIAAFPDGSVIITGETSGIATFGAGGPTETTFVGRGTEGENDILMAHYDANGALLWACSTGGPDNDQGEAVAAFADGSFVIDGESQTGPKTFGHCEPNETVVNEQTVVLRYEGAPVGNALPPPDTGGGRTGELADCPPVEIIFIMDTSSSMEDEAAALCQNLQAIVNEIEQQLGGDVAGTPLILGITDDKDDFTGGLFSCVEDNVLDRFGNTVPGPNPAEATIGPKGASNADEDWGASIAIVSDKHPWGTGNVRIIIVFSDEGPQKGGTSFESAPDDCSTDSTSPDSIAISNAISAANGNSVIVGAVVAGLVVPSFGTIQDTCVVAQATSVANATGGTVFETDNPNSDIADGIVEIVRKACLNTVLD